jgi:regulatory protein
MRMIPEAIERIIIDLIQDNHLNEERFAKAYVRGKFSIKKWGKVRLTLELKQRQISKYVIKTALAEIDPDDYLQAFHALAEKKAPTLTEANPFKRKKKLADYLLYRGWESHLVYDKVNTLIN